MAVLLPARVRQALAGASEELRSLTRGVAWVAPENLHVTLKFLGRVHEERLGALRAALAPAASAVDAFDAVVRGLGAFPTPSRPRVVWAGVVDDGGALAELAARVDGALVDLGFAPEARRFAAHITLGRVREPRRDAALAEALAAGATRGFGRIRVERLALMRSDLSGRGARYTELGASPLGAVSASQDVDAHP